jgi:hypothetical protein
MFLGGYANPLLDEYVKLHLLMNMQIMTKLS